MTANSTNEASSARTVGEQIEELTHRWDHYYCLPYGLKLWPDLVKMDWASERLLRASKAIVLNVLPVLIPLQLLIYFDAVDWISLAADALLVLEIGPCRPLTRLLDRVAPHRCEEICS